MVALAGLVALAVLADPGDGSPAGVREGPAQLVPAAPTRAGDEWSPRRLFNAALRAEEAGNLTLACQLFMAARLAPRSYFADELYARGAALKMIRLLAGRDEDAAVAAALLVGELHDTDLGPLVRSLLKRLEDDDGLERTTGTILSIRYHRTTGRVLLEIEADGAERRAVECDGLIPPFSAGHRVDVLIRRIRGRAAAGWQLLAIASEDADGWQILRVRDLPGQAVEGVGPLIGRVR